MGWYTNYELEFDTIIDWNDEIVGCHLRPFNIQYMYLKDMGVSRAIVSVYSQVPVETIIGILSSLYFTGIKYRAYMSDQEWIRKTI